MRLARRLWSLLIGLLAILLIGWLLALKRLIKELWDAIERWKGRRALTERERKASDAPCEPINQEALHRPDPLIYSQYDLMARGYAVTWDNPDIELRKAGVAVPASALTPATEYESIARIWNNSIDAPVVGLPVIFSFLSFGVGTKLMPIGATAVNLGVKGGPNHPAFASVKWRTPATPGHYCLWAFLAPADDTNPNNNLGQENIVVGKVASPATFTFQLSNQSNRDQTFRFEADTYALPSRRPCDGAGQHDPARPTRVVGAPPPDVPSAHDRRNHPVPEGWTVVIVPSEPVLAPADERTISVTINPPPAFVGRQPVNVNAFDRQGFVGGVTLYVEAP